MPRADVLVVSVDSTGGWRAAAGELRESLARAGARVASISTGPLPQVRTFALTDYVQARAARRAALHAIAEHEPAAIIYCSITAALLWPQPGAVWLDSIGAENRPGRHGVWQRTVERRRLQQAPLVLTMSRRAPSPREGWGREAIVVPCPVECSVPGSRVEPESVAPGPPVAPDGGATGAHPPEPGAAHPSPRDIAALTYAGNPEKKRLELVLAAWRAARRGEETLVVAGVDAGHPALARLGAGDGVEVAGRLGAEDYRGLLRRARCFVAAPVREDYGIAPLEALADGCLLVSTPAPGPYPALALARELDPRLVDEDLPRAIRTALDDPIPGYAHRAAQLLAPFGRVAVDRVIAQDVLPRLLGRSDGP
ncbi:MAG: glycosyltransferase [Solirubrobacteraceae bacterium]